MIEGLVIPPQLGYPILIGAALAIVGYILNRALKNRPGPPTVTEAWDETRKVRDEMTDMRAAFDVMFNHLERVARDWNKGKPYPRFTASEKAILDKIRPVPDPPSGDCLTMPSTAEVQEFATTPRKRL